jgi:hypothetical protein
VGAIIATLAIVAAFAVYTAYASSTSINSSSPQSSTNTNFLYGPFLYSNGHRNSDWDDHGFSQSTVSIPVGQTITVTSTSGSWKTITGTSQNGTASGVLTFTVTGQLSRGYTLSMTGGSINVNGTTYTISSGSAEMNPPATAIFGQGTTSSGGAFLIEAKAYGNFSGSTNAYVLLDFKNAITEYRVVLTGTIQG